MREEREAAVRDVIPGEILLSQRAHAGVDEHFSTEPVPELQLKGFSRPVVAMRLLAPASE